MSVASNTIRSCGLDQRAYQDPDTFRNGKEQYNLTADEQEALLHWILGNFIEAKSALRRETSYTMKHWFERSQVGFYITNGHFKGAMLAAGFQPTNPKDNDWRFRVRRIVNAPKPGSFLAWLLTKHHGDNPLGDLARDAARDRRFPNGDTTESALRTHLLQHGACREARETLHEAWRKYEQHKARQASKSSMSQHLQNC